MSDPDPVLIAAGVIGKDAEQFIQSELGQTVIGMAEQDLQEAIDKLKRVSPWRRRRIQELQNEIHLAERFKSYLMQLVIEGQQAIDTMEARED